jgi:hypothetical protein
VAIQSRRVARANVNSLRRQFATHSRRARRVDGVRRRASARAREKHSRRNRDDDAGVAGRESATQSRRATISNRFIGDA